MDNKKRYRCTFCGGRFEDEIKSTHVCPFCETQFGETDEHPMTVSKAAPAVKEESDELVAFEKTDDQKPTSFLYEIYTLLHDLVYILAVITFIFVFAFRLVGVDGDSMFDTLHNKDYLVVKNNVFCSDYSRGDIVIASVPTFREGKPIVKRVIATEGETVSVLFDDNGNGTVYVDGQPLQEDYIRSMRIDYETVNVTVPENCVFLMGDNRDHSSDSRLIGCVNKQHLLGKVMLIALPGDNSDNKHEGGPRQWSRIGAVN